MRKLTLGLALLLSAIGSSHAVECPTPAPFVSVEKVIALPDALADLHHAKVQLINLWAIWCAPCRKELPMLASLEQSMKNESDIAVQAVHVGAATEQVTDTLSKLGAEELGTASIEDLSAFQALGVYGLPYTLLTMNGTVQFIGAGYLGEDEMPFKEWLVCIKENSEQ
ncbi:TlpA disulfide reductase family protein [Vibrio mimicus]|uniref:TlpA family protein disulfide reductase n=1 Tax=Vibrio mimicus TaxID=674 RepID=UPI002FF37544